MCFTRLTDSFLSLTFSKHNESSLTTFCLSCCSFFFLMPAGNYRHQLA